MYKMCNKHTLLSLSNFLLLFYQILPFWGENDVPFPIFWRINRTPIATAFVK